MQQLTIRLLGAPLIEVGGKPIYVDTRKATALLAYLAMRDGIQRRETLAAFFWPELDERKARAALRRTLSTLKRGLGLAAESLRSDRRNVALYRNDQVWVDVTHVEHQLASCQTNSHTIGVTCAVCASALTEAVALYRDHFLAGFTLRDSEAFDDWQRLNAEHLRQQILVALERLVLWHESCQEYEEAFAYARRWLALDSINEQAHRELMHLYLRDGQRNAALRQYSECVRILQSELGVSPSNETSSLYERIRSGQEETRRALSGPFDKTPLRRHHNLPTGLTPFVGRELELNKIARLLLDDPTCRLLTLTGLGGIGKTRLALQVASEQLDAFPDGVFFVSLVAADTNQALISNMAQVLGLSFEKNQPSDPLAKLVKYLTNKEMLLVLDNFEQLLPDGGQVLTTIMQQVADVKLLVTSRQRLALRGEWVVEVTSLPVPIDNNDEQKYDKVDECSAMTLFVQEAERIQAHFKLTEHNYADVGRIVRLVGGIPLAIELAAAWMRLLTCADIAAELEQTLDFLADSGLNVPARHRSLRVVFEHSWARLTVREQDVLRRLSVFAGHFPRQAAQQVAGATLPLLLSLMDKSLLRRTSKGRLEMHQIVRQYAAQKLSSLQNETQRAHALYYLALGEQVKPEFEGAEASKWLDKVAIEQDNLRTALTWSLTHALEIALQLTAAIWNFWDMRGQWQEGRTWLDQVCAKTASYENSPARGQVLLGAARLASHQGEYETAQKRLSQARASFSALGDKKTLGRTLSELGRLSWRRGEYTAAESYLKETLALSRQIGDLKQVGGILSNLGMLASGRGNYQAAQAFLEESLALKRELGQQEMGPLLGHLGMMADAQGRYSHAERYFNESLQAFKKEGHKWGHSVQVCNLGSLAVVTGDLQTASTHYREALSLFEEQGSQWGMSYVLCGLADVELLSHRIEAAQALYQKSLTLAQKLNNYETIISNVVGLSSSLANNTEKNTQDIVRLLAAVKTFQRAKKIRMPSGARHLYKQALTDGQNLLNDATFEITWAEGSAMTIEEAIEYVLQRVRAAAITTHLRRDSSLPIIQGDTKRHHALRERSEGAHVYRLEILRSG